MSESSDIVVVDVERRVIAAGGAAFVLAALLLAPLASDAGATPSRPRIAAPVRVLPAHAASRPRPTPRPLAHAPSEVVVITDAGVLGAAAGAPATGHERLRSALAGLGFDRARRVDPVPTARAARRAGGVRREEIWLLASRRPGFDPVRAARALQATGAVRAASPNYRFGLLPTLPDDLYLIYQWYVDDGGAADVDLPFAWDIARGDTTAAIAILDTGVDTGHPDLASQIRHNPDEIAGNALDDDGNGLVDDVEGWDFGRGDNDPNPEPFFDEIGLDAGFHGTFCAGIAAASTNNGEGIAGAGWRCRILPVKVAHPDSGITSAAIAAGVAYAVDQGASVISMSFGGPGDPGVPEFFQALVDMAVHAGVLCVAAAGNDGSSVPVYPAACDRILAVGATDVNDARASFSNYGPWVDVSAPGSAMWSTICRNYTIDETSQIFYIFLFGWDGANPYMYGDGTSFACPLVAGVAGLVRARYPAMTPGLVIQHLVATGDDVAPLDSVGPRVNAFAAVSSTPTSVEPGARTPVRARVTAAPNPAGGFTTVRFDLPSEGSVRLLVFDAAGRRVRTLAQRSMPAGPHVLAWDGRGDDGATLPAGVYFARLELGASRLTTKIVLMR